MRGFDRSNWMSGVPAPGQRLRAPLRSPDRSHPVGFQSLAPFRRHRVPSRKERSSALSAATGRKDFNRSKTDQLPALAWRRKRSGRITKREASGRTRSSVRVRVTGEIRPVPRPMPVKRSETTRLVSLSHSRELRTRSRSATIRIRVGTCVSIPRRQRTRREEARRRSARSTLPVGGTVESVSRHGKRGQRGVGRWNPCRTRSPRPNGTGGRTAAWRTGVGDIVVEARE